MDITISRGNMREASLPAISSKSYVHRLLIASALSAQKCFIKTNIISDDMKATAECLNRMGAFIRETEEGFYVESPVCPGKEVSLDCGESGSTARFLLPIASCLYEKVSMTGHGRLTGRPFGPLADAMRENGVSVSADFLPLTTSGILKSGTFRIPGDISSQFITGLLMALPLLNKESAIALSSPLASREYVDITLEVLRRFGIEIRKTDGAYTVSGGQKYELCMQDAGPATESVSLFAPKGPGRQLPVSPAGIADSQTAGGGTVCAAGPSGRKAVQIVPTGPASGYHNITAEGDWSNGGFLLGMGALGPGITLTSLNPASVQGDRAVLDALKAFGADVTQKGGDAFRAAKRPLHGIDINGSDIPDLIPALACVAAFADSESVFRNVGRLRLKESDRIETVKNALKAAGADAHAEEHDGVTDLFIKPVSLVSGSSPETFTIDGANDHRIVMAAALLAAGSG